MADPRRLAPALMTLALAAAAHAKTPGVDCTVDGVGLRVTAVTDTVFRLSVNTDGPAAPLRSIYLDPNRAADVLGAVTPGDVASVKTAAGELRLDTKTGRYTLLDAAGKTVVPWAMAAVPEKARTDRVRVCLGWPKDKPFAVYGSGNPNGALVQREVTSRVDNGIAVEPFFWSPAGFAVFVVGQDADRPMACDGKADGGSVTLVSPGTAADVYLMLAPTLGDATRSLLTLTGRPPVPPLWAFGYLQSRWNWTDAAYIDDTVRQFAEHKLAVDAFIFDFEWYTAFPDYFMSADGNNDFPDFKFDRKLFPNVRHPIQVLDAAGLKFVGIRKPRLGDAASLRMIRANGWDAKNLKVNGPLDRRQINFALPAMRDWYAKQTAPLFKTGVAGWWNDEGEYHYTTYPYWVMAERQALDLVRPGERLWTINRAFCPGMARFGSATWTGDIEAKWSHLRRAPADLLNWSVAGMPYGSTDIGGFAGETNPELLTRWMQAGTFFPNMRTHSTADARPHFPWLWGPDAEAAMKKALDLRYRLVPYLYGLAHACHETGDLLMRPMVVAFPDDAKAAEMNDQWMIGDGVMVAPVLDPGGKRSVYLPAGDWYEFSTGKSVAGGQTLEVTCALDEVPVYVRAGTVLPMATPALRTADLYQKPLELRVYAGRDATFTLVEDDGISQSYLKGDVRKTTFRWTDKTRTLEWKRQGGFAGPVYTKMKLNVIGGKPWRPPEIPLDAGGSATAG